MLYNAWAVWVIWMIAKAYLPWLSYTFNQNTYEKNIFPFNLYCHFISSL
jgi:hypothetical protein